MPRTMHQIFRYVKCIIALPMTAPSQRTCAFCGGQGMTKQHIFGKRLLKLLNGHLGTHLVIESLPNKPTFTKNKDGNVWSKQLRRVCQRCNGGGMRIIEEGK